MVPITIVNGFINQLITGGPHAVCMAPKNAKLFDVFRPMHSEGIPWVLAVASSQLATLACSLMSLVSVSDLSAIVAKIGGLGCF